MLDRMRAGNERRRGGRAKSRNMGFDRANVTHELVGGHLGVRLPLVVGVLAFIGRVGRRVIGCRLKARLAMEVHKRAGWHVSSVFRKQLAAG